MSRFSRLALTALCLLIGAASPVQRRILLGNPNANLLVGLVGYWPCAEASGTTCADQSGNGHLLTLVNAPPRVAAANGVYGQALALTGASSQYATAANPPTTNTTNFTLACRVYISGTSLNGTFLHVGANSTFNGYAFGVGSYTLDTLGNNLVGEVSGAAWLPFNIAIGIGWHTVVMTRDATTWRGYVDGVVSATTFTQPTSAPASGTNYGMAIGRDSDSSVRYFSGNISSCHVAARAWQAYEVAQFQSYPF